ncbi:DHHC palmitoyltransferase-domain-containing protein [Crassisporium funariophilum]|nr:DHHC palmitoyltransferase-domain-containing protein [Crassisporium funariophilum]
MSSTPHSLNFSPSIQQSLAANTHAKRNSLGSIQLPLPTSLTAPPTLRPTGTLLNTTLTNAGPSSPTTRAFAIPGRLPGDIHQQPNSPTLSTFPLPLALPLPAHPPPVHTSSTHAGGIQPSASFFRPSRPTYQPQYSRPSSPSSLGGHNNNNNNSTLAPEQGDVFQLAPISTHIMDRSADDHHNQIAESIGGGNESSMEEQGHFLSLKRMKQSREPLLPVGASRSGVGAGAGGGGSQVTRLSMTRERSASGSNPMASPTRSASRLVRHSLDRVFSISRGLSFDSIRKSTAEGGGRPTFESKLSDEEQARGPHSPANGHGNAHAYNTYSPTTTTPGTPHYVNSPTHTTHHHHRHPPHFTGGQSLSVRLTSHSAPSPPPSPSPSPTPSSQSAFHPVPPSHRPPLSAVPLLNPTTNKVVRRYEVHPSRNRFAGGGRVLSGGDSPWAFVASFGLVCVIAGVWFGTTAVWWWREVSPGVAGVGAYLSLLTISTMLATATIDPGILPRNLDPEPPYPATSPSDGGVRAPMPRDLKVRTDVVRVKYCPTCKTYRPPRSSHCKMCDNCVDGCDHHCQWVNNCIGRRNYTTFFALLLAATTTLILIIITSALHLVLLTRREHIPFRLALRRGVGSAVVFCLAIAVVWPVAALLSYHMRVSFFVFPFLFFFVLFLVFGLFGDGG